MTARRRILPAAMPLASLALAGLTACSGGVQTAEPAASPSRSTGPAATSGGSTPTETPTSTTSAHGGTAGRPSGATGSPTAPARPPATTTPATSGTPGATTAAGPSGDQKALLDRVPGNPQPGCVDVGDRSDVRSGSLVVGNFVEARAEVAKGGPNGAELQFYVFPQHAASMPGVRLTATPPTGQPRTVTSKRTNQGDDWSYYRVALPVHDRGVWRLEVTAGPDSGCFVVRF